MVNFSVSKQRNSSTPRNPGTGIGGAILADLFGGSTNLQNGKFVLGTGRQPTGGKFGVDGRPHQFDGSTDFDSAEMEFNAGAGLAERSGFGAIRNLAGNVNEIAQDAGRRGQDIFGASSDALLGLIREGGQPVDTSALSQAGLTDLKEQFSGLGGLFSSDIQAAQGRNALELQVGAEEAARQRQLEALGLGQSLAQNQLQFAGDFERIGTEGGRALTLFQNLFGQQSTNLFSEGADTKGKGSSFGGGIASFDSGE